MAVRNWDGEVLVNTNTAGVQTDSNVVALAGGGWVVVWTDFDIAGGDGSGSSIKFQQFDAAGAAVGGETIANSGAAGTQATPSLVATEDGGFVVAWIDSGATDVECRRFSSSGIALDAADRVLPVPGGQFDPQLTTDGTGFLVVFQDLVGAAQDVVAQRFLSNGTANGGQIDITTNASRSPCSATSRCC